MKKLITFVSLALFALEANARNNVSIAGSSTVFVEGKALARIGDSADAGSMTSGSSNVFSG